MIIGRMNKRIKLQKPNLIPDGRGGQKPAPPPAPEYLDVATVWAEFRNPNFKELSAMGTAVSEMNQLTSIRRRTDIQRGWRFLYGTKKFNVLNTFEPDRETTMIVARDITVGK
ncbi:SPP1 family predicted phage head-tail adaptor [Sporomusaceae bacterium BoRhaA]|uniref:phage head closure protein n=1 Tax=Pelorhabdus rhamnosifermentans TaxID=2772457 RepID=UPI001C06369C|nr:phage head closure protein [Pelorhabdus rhamnosifermentans]MBU2703880.1 SPP1 family predicted phage head-tail adaptor [Pelorhabdus rhamnosifermentans]